MTLQFRVVSALAVSGLVLAALQGPALAKRHRRSHAEPAASDASRAESCVAAFKGAQEREDAGQLAAAKELWLKCAHPTCGSFLKQECTTRYTQVEIDMPSVVPLVLDDNGDPRTDVQVRIDGQVVASQLDGRALQVDPGMHEFSFSADGDVFARQKLMILQGQRNRQISAPLHAAGSRAPARSKIAMAAPEKAEREPDLAPASAGAADQKDGKEGTALASAKAERSDDSEAQNASDAGGNKEAAPGESHALSYVLGGAGLASLGAGALVIYWGRKDNDLLGQCSPSCPPGNVSHIRNMYLGGDVALGLGVASLAASYLVYALSHGGTPAAEEKATQEAYLFNVLPTSSGALAAVSGSF